jgi:predicted acetyltransferase
MSMITDEVIEDLADGLYRQYEFINKCYEEEARQKYFVQLRDDTILVANVVHKHNRFYDMDEFYRRSGYVGVAPRYN